MDRLGVVGDSPRAPSAKLATAIAEVARLTAENAQLSQLADIIEAIPTTRSVSITLTVKEDRGRRGKLIETRCEAVVCGDGQMYHAVAGDFQTALTQAAEKWLARTYY